MSFVKRRELTYSEDKFIPFRTGYSLGTVYMLNPETHSTIKLQNFGYCPAEKEFYYNRNIHLPKEIIEYFENRCLNNKTIAQMEELGIYNSDDTDKLIRQYENSKVQTEIEKEKILNFKRTIKLMNKRENNK